MSLLNREYDCVTDALFLDFDGTLVDLAAQPAAVLVPSPLLMVLGRLQQDSGGAVAIISGRPLSELDHFLAPLLLPAAGVHGLERRDARGKVLALPVPRITNLMDRLNSLVARHAGLLLEPKRGALALHYRQAPHLEQTCIEAMRHAITRVPGFILMHGKMVVEAKAKGADKGLAIAAFMAEAPFAGRRPLFAGDDVTDEAGFAWVQAAGGIGIKIGAGPSQAQCWLDSPQSLFHWLGQGLDMCT